MVHGECPIGQACEPIDPQIFLYGEEGLITSDDDGYRSVLTDRA